MSGDRFVWLIEVHFRGIVFLKNQELTLEEMGPHAYSLFRLGLVKKVEAVLPSAAAA